MPPPPPPPPPPPAASADVILEANHARRSVIVEKRRAAPEGEYVHKIRRAGVPLPPIDRDKIESVRRGIPAAEPAPPRNLDIYHKILYGRAPLGPKALWRRKLERDA